MDDDLKVAIQELGEHLAHVEQLLHARDLEESDLGTHVALARLAVYHVLEGQGLLGSLCP